MEENVNRNVNTNREKDEETDIFSGFQWPVARHGYRVEAVQYSADEEPQLSIVDDCPEGAMYRWRVLKTCPELYRTFTEINTENPDSILTFANKYGMLNYKIFTRAHQRAEPLGSWKSAIWPMRHAVQLWDNLKNTGWLKERISWNGRDRFLYAPDFPQPPDEEFDWPPWTVNTRLQELYEKRTYAVVSWYLLQHTINQHLQKEISAQILRKRDLLHLDLYFKPNRLVSGLWLQLAQDVTGNREVKRCEHCRKRNKRAAQSRYCTNSCRTMADRKRKKQIAA